MHLVFEQQVVQLPEFVLRACRFCRLRRELGMRVHFTLRKMPEHKAHTIPEMLEQYFYCMVSLTAGWTFEISVLKKGDLRRFHTQYVIGMIHGDGERVR